MLLLLSHQTIGVGTGGYSPPNILGREAEPLHLQPSIVIIQTF